MGDPGSDRVEFDIAPVCPTCGTKLDEGWCPVCSKKRTANMLWLLFLVVPLFSSGSCLMFALDPKIGPLGHAVVNISTTITVVSPVAGLIYLVVSQSKDEKRGK